MGTREPVVGVGLIEEHELRGTRYAVPQPDHAAVRVVAHEPVHHLRRREDDVGGALDRRRARETHALGSVLDGTAVWVPASQPFGPRLDVVVAPYEGLA